MMGKVISSVVIMLFLLNTSSLSEGYDEKSLYETSLPKLMVKFIFNTYIKYISPADSSRCAYYPTCSKYSQLSIKQCGMLRGTIMSFDRIQRCHYCAFYGNYPIEHGRLIDLVEDNNFW
ncbi:MAG: membrane protein insertion efficiency factor YidD [bacterium]